MKKSSLTRLALGCTLVATLIKPCQVQAYTPLQLPPHQETILGGMWRYDPDNRMVYCEASCPSESLWPSSATQVFVIGGGVQIVMTVLNYVFDRFTNKFGHLMGYLSSEPVRESPAGYLPLEPVMDFLELDLLPQLQVSQLAASPDVALLEKLLGDDVRWQNENLQYELLDRHIGGRYTSTTSGRQIVARHFFDIDNLPSSSIKLFLETAKEGATVVDVEEDKHRYKETTLMAAAPAAKKEGARAIDRLIDQVSVDFGPSRDIFKHGLSSMLSKIEAGIIDAAVHLGEDKQSLAIIIKGSTVNMIPSVLVHIASREGGL